MLSRREFITLGALGALAPEVLAAAAPSRVFQHGVASGDPRADRVVLWTRVTVQGSAAEGRWRIADDPRLTRVVARGRFATGAERDYTVKVDVGGLAPGRTYYYAFETRGERSPVGRTRTLPAGQVGGLRLAFASCAAFPHGYYNAYARIAERADLDLVLHLGDYMYENALGEYVSADPAVAAARAVVPAHELVALADYRLRYSLYRRDPDLQEVHRQHPFVCVWDDHEIANDAWRDGAHAHQPEREGPWTDRRRAAVRAYREWLPIRDEGPPERIYRSFPIGGLADVLMLDTRLIGRDRQAAGKAEGEIAADDPRLVAASRSLLGAPQEAWLDAELAGSQARGVRWQLLGQQVMMAPLSVDGGRTVRNADQWDGYPAARARLYASLRARTRGSAIVLAGDLHSSLGNELAPNPWATGAEATPLAVEFVTPAISSSPPFADATRATFAAAALRATSPHVKFVDFQRRGYTLLDVRADRVQAEHWHVPTVDRRAPGEQLANAFVVEHGRAALLPADSPSPARSAPDPAPSA